MVGQLLEPSDVLLYKLWGSVVVVHDRCNRTSDLAIYLSDLVVNGEYSLHQVEYEDMQSSLDETSNWFPARPRMMPGTLVAVPIWLHFILGVRQEWFEDLLALLSRQPFSVLVDIAPKQLGLSQAHHTGRRRRQ